MKKIIFLLSLVAFVCIQKTSAKISLIWQVDRQVYWEEDWLMEALSGLDIDVVDDGKYEKFIDKSIIIISSPPKYDNQSPLKAYIKKLKKMNYKFGFIVLNDENGSGLTNYYKHAQFVFKIYWHEKYARFNNVVVIPLGYKKGLVVGSDQSLCDISQRKYIWSFAGQIIDKPTRKAMISSMRKIPNHFVHEIFAWDAPNSLKIDAYQDLMFNSIFIPCPTGWAGSLECFRVYEALECGCIPIVEKKPIDYFTKFLGDHPFLSVSSWSEAPRLINDLLQDPVRLEERRKRCLQWWNDYKKNMSSKLAHIVQDAFL